MAETELPKETTQEVHEEEKWRLESVNTDLTRNCVVLKVRYENKQLELLIAEAKLMQAEGSNNPQIAKLRKLWATTLYHVSMGEEKVWPMIKAHKLKTLQLVAESLDKGWMTWLAQATKVQLLHTNKENRKVSGQEFFKITEEHISPVQEDLAWD